ncbi:MAG: PrgI family protein [Patescibacteria group bacterium]|nr:PrgI family protein [Patescibacteria group bacterium]
MQFQVPQFIETEDKIVGPFTLKQFIVVGVSVGISLVLYFIVVPWLWIILSIPIVGAGASLAFIRVGGRSLPVVAQAAIRYFWKPQTYVWQPQQPHAPTTPSPQEHPSHESSLEEILSGLALRTTWQKLQTGKKISPGTLLGHTQDRYTIFRKRTGERNAARRIDYR